MCGYVGRTHSNHPTANLGSSEHAPYGLLACPHTKVEGRSVAVQSTSDRVLASSLPVPCLEGIPALYRQGPACHTMKGVLADLPADAARALPIDCVSAALLLTFLHCHLRPGLSPVHPGRGQTGGHAVRLIILQHDSKGKAKDILQRCG